MVSFTLNGTRVDYDGDETQPLLWVIRDVFHLKGTKFGCGAGLCGACTVHVNGGAQRSCVTPVQNIVGAEIVTIEGLSASAGDQQIDGLHPVQKAWLDTDVPQCGYCQAGQIMATADLLARNPRPSDEDIDREHTNLCRCGTYDRIRSAIHHAADLVQEAPRTTAGAASADGEGGAS